MADKVKSPALPQPFVGTKGARAPNVPLNAVTIYNVETGEAAQVKPINATEAVEGGHWSFEPPKAKAKSGESGEESEARDERERELKGLSADEVKAIAATADIEYTNKAEAIEAILDAEFPE